MNSDVQIRLLRAMHACMRPIARILLRSGISYKQFADVAKLAFVQEAFEDAKRTGSKTNVSRVAVQTGMSRKEIAKIFGPTYDDETFTGYDGLERVGPAARLLQVWHVDSRYLDALGRPMELEFEGDGYTFSELVRRVSGDFTAGSVKSELEASGAVIELANGKLRALKRYFVPGDIGEELLTGVTRILFPVVEGLARNTGPERVDGSFIQRFSYTDRLAANALPVFRGISRDRVNDFVQLIDDWLSVHELPLEQGNHVDGRIAGLGVFYYESPGQ